MTMETEELFEKSEGSVEMDEAEESEVSMDSNFSESEIRNIGNLGWANAMSKVLNTNVSKEKNFILSKAKKDADIKRQKTTDEIEIVDEAGNIKSTKAVTSSKNKSIKQKRLENFEKRKQKSAWESMCRVKPDITQKEKERELIRIATKGVVHLFNTVEKHQKGKSEPSMKKEQQKLGKLKGNFMDILKGHSKAEATAEVDFATKKAKQEETWNILKDDFMIGAEMKDWDKESDTDL